MSFFVSQMAKARGTGRRAEINHLAILKVVHFHSILITDLVIVGKQSKVQYLRTEANDLSGNPVRTIPNNPVPVVPVRLGLSGNLNVLCSDDKRPRNRLGANAGILALSRKHYF